MTDSPTGLLVVFVYSAAVALSLPAAAGVFLLSRRLGHRRSSDVVGLVGVGVVAIGGIVVGALAGPIAGLLLAGIGFIAIVLLWAFPVLLGAYVVGRLEGTSVEESIGYAVAGLPAALIASAVLFVAPGGLAQYNLTFFAGSAMGAVLLGVGVVVFLGPGFLGAGLHRLVERRQ